MSIEFSKVLNYLQLAFDVSKMSRDFETKVGAVIVGPDLEVRSIGYNGFPRKVEERTRRKYRPEKYKWTEHAERNAIYNAARVGTPLKGSTLFVTMRPCPDCARAIIQAGIETVYTFDQTSSSPIWEADNDLVAQMFYEAGVTMEVMSVRRREDGAFTLVKPIGIIAWLKSKLPSIKITWNP